MASQPDGWQDDIDTAHAPAPGGWWGASHGGDGGDDPNKKWAGCLAELHIYVAFRERERKREREGERERERGVYTSRHTRE